MNPRLNTIKKKKSLTKKGWRWYFIIVAPNGEKLERSQMYKYRQSRNARVRALQRYERINVEDQPRD